MESAHPLHSAAESIFLPQKSPGTRKYHEKKNDENNGKKHVIKNVSEIRDIPPQNKQKRHKKHSPPLGNRRLGGWVAGGWVAGGWVAGWLGGWLAGWLAGWVMVIDFDIYIYISFTKLT